MHPELEQLLYLAEDRYLQTADMKIFRDNMTNLSKALAVYEQLREQEITIFQSVADQLVTICPQASTQQLEMVLQHWIAILRYVAMAALLNNSAYLERRLLEWLSDVVRVYQLEALNQQVYDLLQAELATHLTVNEVALLQPFLTQVQTTLTGSQATSAVLK